MSRGTERGDGPATAGQRAASLDRIRETYATQADRMARLSWLNRLVTGRYRRQMFGRAEGRVLDVACGTGLNLEYLPEDVEYVGVDISPEMLANARERHGTSPGVSFREMDAGALAFEDQSFDAVISSLSTGRAGVPGRTRPDRRRPHRAPPGVAGRHTLRESRLPADPASA